MKGKVACGEFLHCKACSLCEGSLALIYCCCSNEIFQMPL